MLQKALFIMIFFVSLSANATSYLEDWMPKPLWKQFKFSPSMYVGSGEGNFNWNIGSSALNRVSPNVLSELSYDNLSIQRWQFETLGKLPLNNGRSFITELSMATGSIETGVIRDSDYDQDNRQGEYSRSLSDPQGSEVLDMSFAAGFSQILSNSWTGSVLLGYSTHQQNFEKTNGEQVLSTDFRTPSLGTFEGLNSQYYASWEGLWVGAQAEWKMKSHSLQFRVEQHWTQYYAEADWNLRTDFAHPKSFDHVANGIGTIARLEYKKSFGESLGVNIRYQLESWLAEDGLDTVYFANGNTATTQLNSSSWSQNNISVGLSYLTW